MKTFPASIVLIQFYFHILTLLIQSQQLQMMAGMTRSEVIVNVEKTNSFIISIYTPNEDRVNDYIRYHAGKDVKEILYLKIY